MSENYLEIAAEMLGKGDEVWAGNLHPDLIRMLEDQAALIEKLKGLLVSRQEIAGMIITWQRMNPGLSAYKENS